MSNESQIAMTLKFKFIEFIPSGDKKYPYECINRKHQTTLGFIGKQWGENCFFPSDRTVFSVDCLRDIITACKELT